MLKLRPLMALLVLSLLVWVAAGQNERAVTASTPTPSTATLARCYPGWYGGGFWDKGSLQCKRLVCSPNWRSSCTGSVDQCQKQFCKWETATPGAVCDIHPCLQGNCFNGVCCGGSAANCPNPDDDCKRYKCDQRSGQCTITCPAPNGAPCKNGTGSCQSGKCIPVAPQCPPVSNNKCLSNVYNNTTQTCEKIPTKCGQPPELDGTCKILRCNPRTGDCDSVGNKPPNTPCPDGNCKNGICVPSAQCPSKCPNSTNPCTFFSCNPATKKCTEKPIPGKPTCSGGTCKHGICVPTPTCPIPCRVHPNKCKIFECNYDTGRCTNEANKNEGETCRTPAGKAGQCDGEGTCIPDVGPTRNCNPATCPKPAGDPNGCQILKCNTTTGQCNVPGFKDVGANCTVSPGVKGTCNAQGDCVAPINPTCSAECGKEETKGCQTLSCNSTTGLCNVPVNRPAGDTCDDNSKCTTDDKCDGFGHCSGTRTTCSQDAIHADGLQCVEAVCNDRTGLCINVTSADDVACNDGSNCTTGDKCKCGTCLPGSPVVCAAPSTSLGACKIYTCDPTTGTCTTKNATEGTPCSDGNGCTEYDKCFAGECIGTPIVCPPSSDNCKEAFCSKEKGQCDLRPLDDGTVCRNSTMSDCRLFTCKSGTCMGNQTSDCSCYGNSCNEGICSTETNQCVKVPKSNGTGCSDGNPCTINDMCQAGWCKPGTPKVCNNPPNTCLATQGTCCAYNGECSYSPVVCSPTTAQCKKSQCSSESHLPFPANCLEVADETQNGNNCTDGNKCTAVDKCLGGLCIPGDAVECDQPPDNQCQYRECDPNQGCVLKYKAEGVVCNIDNGYGNCTVNTCDGKGGCIQRSATNCTGAGDDCNLGQCNNVTGTCYKVAKNINESCSTGTNCQVNEKCQLEADGSGVCTGGMTRECTPGLCQDAVMCNVTSGQCDIITPKNCTYLDTQCAQGVCSNTGACTTQAINDGSACNDKLFCNVDEACSNGVCTGGKPRNCTDDDNTTCTNPTCTENNGGMCVFTPKVCDLNPDGSCFSAGCDKFSDQCYNNTKPENTSCTFGLASGCTGKCSSSGTCVQTSCPGSCNSNSDCVSSKCCCDNVCVTKLSGDCGFTCADSGCKKAGGPKCQCIKSCTSSGANGTCSSVGGNPCKANGVCCCASGLGTFGQACPDCVTPCTSKNCTGDLPPSQVDAICNASTSVAA